MMDEVYDEKGRAIRLADRLARGGQGIIYRLKGTDLFCAKVYHEKPDAVQTQKLKVLREREPALSRAAALPKSLAFADAGLASPIGIIMPYVRGHEIHELYGTRARLHHFPKANFKFLVHAAYNLALVFDELHRSRIVVGDISEQNIKVLPDATVRLIDCDSFQVADGSKLYTSDVGTPLWTPPELQGKNLSRLSRTPNHDLFGLAQLIFLLFFAGRHPFAGVPRTQRYLTPEAAISEHAFVFAPEALAPLAPPPGCPPFSALPPRIQQLFLRAFLKGSELPDARPTAGEWKDCIAELLNNLTACTLVSEHIFWKKAAACPWCAVAREAEIDLFPSHTDHVSDTNIFVHKSDGQAMRLRNLRPYSFSVEPPPPFDDLVPMSLPDPPNSLWSSLQKTVAIARWKKNLLSEALAANRKELAEAEVSVNNFLIGQHALVAEYNREFSKLRNALLPLLRQSGRPAQIQREVEGALAAERRQFQLQELLERMPMHNAALQGIGLGSKATLMSYGIETAADISPAMLGKIPGFDPAHVSELLAWRKACEGHFKFDPTKPWPAALRHEIERRILERLKLLKEEVAGFDPKFTELQRRFATRLNLAKAQTAEAAKKLGQAKINIAFLEEQLRAC